MIQNINMWKSETVIPPCNQKEYNYTVLIVIYTINLAHQKKKYTINLNVLLLGTILRVCHRIEFDLRVCLLMSLKIINSQMHDLSKIHINNWMLQVYGTITHKTAISKAI